MLPATDIILLNLNLNLIICLMDLSLTNDWIFWKDWIIFLKLHFVINI